MQDAQMSQKTRGSNVNHQNPLLKIAKIRKS